MHILSEWIAQQRLKAADRSRRPCHLFVWSMFYVEMSMRTVKLFGFPPIETSEVLEYKERGNCLA